MKVQVSVSLLVLLAGCGGSNPAGPGPSPEPPTFTYTVLAARTSRPVAGAAVQVAGTGDYRTDSSGVVTVKARSGQTLSILAPGFVSPRIFRIVADSTEYLWEDDSLTPLDFIRELVYRGSDSGTMYRPTVPTAVVGVDPTMYNDNNFHRALLSGLDVINSADNNVQWSAVAGNPPGGGVVSIRMVVEPGNPFWAVHPQAAAFAEITFQRSSVTGGRVVFKSLRSNINYATAVAHELGHIRGFDHAPGGLMDAHTTAVVFSRAERDLMRNMFLRPPGNMFPDDSTRADFQASSGRRTLQVCTYPGS